MKKMICLSLLSLTITSFASMANAGHVKQLTVISNSEAAPYLHVQTDNPFDRQNKSGSFTVVYKKNIFGNFPRISFVNQLGEPVKVIGSSCNLYQNYNPLGRKINVWKIGKVTCAINKNKKPDCRKITVEEGTCT